MYQEKRIIQKYRTLKIIEKNKNNKYLTYKDIQTFRNTCILKTLLPQRN